MNAILSLCHFCEIHGPTVLLSTQAFHYDGTDDRESVISPATHFFGPIKKLGEYSAVLSQSSNKVACEACNSVNGYITNDYQNKISFLSTRLAVDKTVSSLLKQAAIRSLSCEVVPGKEGQIYFGDSIRGHVLSHTFFLKDTQARGFHRWFSIIVFMKDKHFLLNSWSFFYKHIKQLVCHLQEMAAEVYANEQNKGSHRALRLTHLDQTDLDSRSLIKLTGSATVFANIHLWFTWLLSIGATRLEESVPTRSFNCNIQEQQDSNGFIVIKESDGNRAEINSEEIITETRKLRNVLGFLKFQILLNSALVGHQIVIRGPKSIVIHIINILRFFVPKNKFRCLEYADSYQTPDVCNVIGLNLHIAVPKPTANILRLDIVLREDASKDVNTTVPIFDDYELLLKTGRDLPAKWPSLLVKMDKAIADSTLNDKVVFLHLNSLIEEWRNLTEVILKVKTKRKNSDVMGLFQCLGVQDHDDQLIEFWTS